MPLPFEMAFKLPGRLHTTHKLANLAHIEVVAEGWNILGHAEDLMDVPKNQCKIVKENIILFFCCFLLLEIREPWHQGGPWGLLTLPQSKTY